MKQKTPRPLHKANEQGIKKGRISIQLLFGTFTVYPSDGKIYMILMEKTHKLQKKLVM